MSTDDPRPLTPAEIADAQERLDAISRAHAEAAERRKAEAKAEEDARKAEAEARRAAGEAETETETDATATKPPARTPAEIEAELERTRNELRITVDALSSRLAPAALGTEMVDHTWNGIQRAVDASWSAGEHAVGQARRVAKDVASGTQRLVSTASASAAEHGRAALEKVRSGEALSSATTAGRNFLHRLRVGDHTALALVTGVATSLATVITVATVRRRRS